MSSYLNTLYNAATILEIMKNVGVVYVGNTHSKSPLTLKVKRISHHFPPARTKYSQRTRACKHTNTIFMYKKAFNKLHAAQRQFLGSLNYLNRESIRVLSCEFILVHSSLTMISLKNSDSWQFSYLYMNLASS